MHLYKYLPKIFSEALLKRGSIRIGTLSDYRKPKHKSGILDYTEGKKKVNLDINEKEHYKYLHKTPDALNGFIGINGECKNLTLSDIHTTTNYLSENLYIYCLSSEASLEVMNEFEGAEVCLELVFQEEFFCDLNRMLRLVLTAKFQGLFECSYQDRTIPVTSGKDSIGVHSAIIKEKDYCGQKEIRAIWRNSGENATQPYTINNSHLGRYFQEVHF